MSAQTAQHDIAQLESDISRMYAALAALGSHRGEPTAADDSSSELFKLIHRPGWTTPAEFALVTSFVRSITAGAESLAEMHAALLAGSRSIGR